METSISGQNLASHLSANGCKCTRPRHVRSSGRGSKVNAVNLGPNPTMKALYPASTLPKYAARSPGSELICQEILLQGEPPWSICITVLAD